MDGRNPFDCYDPNIQISKSHVFIVTGESGSGKSVHACLQAKRLGYLPVYCLLGQEGVAHPKKPIFDFPLLNGLLSKCIDSCEKKERRMSNNFSNLCSMKPCHNPSRNGWAKGMIRAALEGYIKDGEKIHLSQWLEGSWSQERRPKKVAIIIDEATDTDLAEGLVAVVTEIRVHYQQRLAKNDVMIIIIGTGLEAMKHHERSWANPLLVNGPPDESQS